MPSPSLSSPEVRGKICATAQRLSLLRKKLFQNGYGEAEVETIILEKIFKNHKVTELNLLQIPSLPSSYQKLATVVYLHIVEISKYQKDYVRLLNKLIRLIDHESSKLQINLTETSSDEEEESQQEQSEVAPVKRFPNPFTRVNYKQDLINTIKSLNQQFRYKIQSMNFNAQLSDDPLDFRPL